MGIQETILETLSSQPTEIKTAVIGAAAAVITAVIGFALVVAIELAARYFEKKRRVAEEAE